MLTKPKTIIPAILLFFLLSAVSTLDDDFKFKQLQYENVKTAYIDKENDMKKLVLKKGIKSFANHMLLRVFKAEEIIELYIKPPNATSYTLLKKYKICEKSGEFGPKTKLGDKQIPEGFYNIELFDHENEHLLGLGINYPNQADKNRGSQNDEVFLWGGCKANGSIPVSDEGIKEIYVMAVEAKAAGQQKIPIQIFPAGLTSKNLDKLQNLYPGDSYLSQFWASLKVNFDYFNANKKELNYSATPNGVYTFHTGDETINVPQESPEVIAKNNKPSTTLPKNIETKNEVSPQGSVASIPQKEVEQKTQLTRTKSVSGEELHTVEKGETLFAISRKHGITLNELKSWNRLWSNNIKVGQQLKVSKPKFYEVHKGDTMYSIAKKNGISLDELQKLNGKDNYLLAVGEIVRVVP